MASSDSSKRVGGVCAPAPLPVRPLVPHRCTIPHRAQGAEPRLPPDAALPRHHRDERRCRELGFSFPRSREHGQRPAELRPAEPGMPCNAMRWGRRLLGWRIPGTRLAWAPPRSSPLRELPEKPSLSALSVLKYIQKELLNSKRK